MFNNAYLLIMDTTDTALLLQRMAACSQAGTEQDIKITDCWCTYVFITITCLVCTTHLYIHIFVVVFIRYPYIIVANPSTRNYKGISTHTVAGCEETSSLCLAPPVAVYLQVSSILVTGNWYLQMFGCIHQQTWQSHA